MSITTRDGSAPGPFFDVGAGWLPTAQQLDQAGLPGGPLAAVRLDVVRITPTGKWHPVLPGGPGAGCARVRRAVDEGRTLVRRQAGLLTGLGLCRACAAQIRPPGRAGAYLDLARHIIAARAWTQELEEAAPHADWPACVRWTARTPFARQNVLALLHTLGGDPDWQLARNAATAAWQQLWARANAAHAQGRLAAGPPGLRAHAAAARAVVAAQHDTVMENELIAAIRGGPDWWKASAPAPAWGVASRAELARTPDAPAPGHEPGSASGAIVVLPGFTARHAAAHQSPNLTATAGPVVPASSAPSPDQIGALIRYAAAIHAGRTHRLAAGVGAGQPAGAQHRNGEQQCGAGRCGMASARSAARG